MLSRPRPCPSGKERAQKKAPSPNSAKGLSKLGARDRVRTGDPQLGNVTVAAKLLWFSSYEWK
jgi:hypothetical protein